MNVIHINALTNGGAASGAYRLHEAMLRGGINSIILTGQSDGSDENIIAINNRNEFLYKVEQKLFSYIRNNNDIGKLFYNQCHIFRLMRMM